MNLWKRHQSFGTAIGLACLILALSIPVFARVWFDFLHGGSPWRQGDWLINSGAGFVRRSLIGDTLIWLSDLLGITPLSIVLVLQSGLYAALLGVLWAISLFRKHQPLLLLLALSPAFFLMFWAGDVQGIMRKEIFGLLTMALLALASATGSKSAIYPTTALIAFTLGCIGNALHFFMLPMVLLGFWLLACQGLISKRKLWHFSILATAIALAWFGIAVWARHASDLEALCAPLVARGLETGICTGALKWTVADQVDHHAELIKRLSAPAILQFLAVTFLAMGPICILYKFTGRKALIIGGLMITFLPFAPLYPAATDWGRWMSLSYTAFVFLSIQAQNAGMLELRNPPSYKLYLLLAVPALLITYDHGIGWMPGGALQSLARTIAIYL